METPKMEDTAHNNVEQFDGYYEVTEMEEEVVSVMWSPNPRFPDKKIRLQVRPYVLTLLRLQQYNNAVYDAEERALRLEHLKKLIPVEDDEDELKKLTEERERLRKLPDDIDVTVEMLLLPSIVKLPLTIKGVAIDLSDQNIGRLTLKSLPAEITNGLAERLMEFVNEGKSKKSNSRGTSRARAV